MGTCCSKEDGPTRTTSELQRVEGSVESHAPRYKYIAGLILGKPSTFLKPGLMDERKLSFVVEVEDRKLRTATLYNTKRTGFNSCFLFETQDPYPEVNIRLHDDDDQYEAIPLAVGSYILHHKNYELLAASRARGEWINFKASASTQFQMGPARLRAAGICVADVKLETYSLALREELKPILEAAARRAGIAPGASFDILIQASSHPLPASSMPCAPRGRARSQPRTHKGRTVSVEGRSQPHTHWVQSKHFYQGSGLKRTARKGGIDALSSQQLLAHADVTRLAAEADVIAAVTRSSPSRRGRHEEAGTIQANRTVSSVAGLGGGNSGIGGGERSRSWSLRGGGGGMATVNESSPTSRQATSSSTPQNQEESGNADATTAGTGANLAAAAGAVAGRPPRPPLAALDLADARPPLSPANGGGSPAMVQHDDISLRIATPTAQSGFVSPTFSSASDSQEKSSNPHTATLPISWQPLDGSGGSGGGSSASAEKGFSQSAPRRLAATAKMGKAWRTSHVGVLGTLKFPSSCIPPRIPSNTDDKSKLTPASSVRVNSTHGNDEGGATAHQYSNTWQENGRVKRHDGGEAYVGPRKDLLSVDLTSRVWVHRVAPVPMPATPMSPSGAVNGSGGGTQAGTGVSESSRLIQSEGGRGGQPNQEAGSGAGDAGIVRKLSRRLSQALMRRGSTRNVDEVDTGPLFIHLYASIRPADKAHAKGKGKGKGKCKEAVVVPIGTSMLTQREITSALRGHRLNLPLRLAASLINGLDDSGGAGSPVAVATDASRGAEIVDGAPLDISALSLAAGDDSAGRLLIQQTVLTGTLTCRLVASVCPRASCMYREAITELLSAHRPATHHRMMSGEMSGSNPTSPLAQEAVNSAQLMTEDPCTPIAQRDAVEGLNHHGAGAQGDIAASPLAIADAEATANSSAATRGAAESSPAGLETSPLSPDSTENTATPAADAVPEPQSQATPTATIPIPSPSPSTAAEPTGGDSATDGVAAAAGAVVSGQGDVGEADGVGYVSDGSDSADTFESDDEEDVKRAQGRGDNGMIVYPHWVHPRTQRERDDLVLSNLTQILAHPCNSCCADCGQRNPSWCCIDKGIFVCSRCALVHADGISTMQHSFCDRNRWTATHVEHLLHRGNAVVNSLLASHRALSGLSSITPDSSIEKRARHIQLKYGRRAAALPCKKTFPDIAMPDVVGNVTITVLGGHNLPPMSNDGRPGLPFMILVLGSSRILLESTEPTRDPVWTGAANTVPWNGADELQLQLMTVPPLPPADADAASDMEGEYGGRAVVSLEGIPCEKTQELLIALTDVPIHPTAVAAGETTEDEPDTDGDRRRNSVMDGLDGDTETPIIRLQLELVDAGQWQPIASNAPVVKPRTQDA